MTGILEGQFFTAWLDSPWQLVIHILDILIVAYAIYRLIKALAGTKIMTLIQGVILFILIKIVAEWIGFTTITYLMNQVITYGVIAGVVIFAPEIRAGLEKFGRTTQVFVQTPQLTDEEKLVESVIKAVSYMSPRKIGALISIERTQTLQDYVSTGIPLNAEISSQLLINIFIPNTPLHDGAVIIQGNKIATACSYLPISESKSISKEFGTRHRAAIGLSKSTDALTVVVSEETGGISITNKGEFLHDLDKEMFETILRSQLLTQKVNQRVWYRKLWRKRK